MPATDRRGVLARTFMGDPRLNRKQRDAIAAICAHDSEARILGIDSNQRPVVVASTGIPRQLRTWAILRNGDPTDVGKLVEPWHTTPATTRASAQVGSARIRCLLLAATAALLVSAAPAAARVPAVSDGCGRTAAMCEGSSPTGCNYRYCDPRLTTWAAPTTPRWTWRRIGWWPV